MNTGTQRLLETVMATVMKSLNLEPEAVKGQIGQIGQTVASFDAVQKRMETKLDLILKHLGIEHGQFDRTIDHDGGQGKAAKSVERAEQ